MLTIILLVHLMLAIALVGLVLVQRSEGGALGIGGGGGGGFLSGRGAANLLTRSTTVVAALFIVTSLTLAKLSGGPSVQPSILDAPLSTAPATAPAEVPTPAEPTAPLAR
jgi:preprotein translocase subunit SecG